MARSKSLEDRLAKLSPKKRALLEKRLKGKSRLEGKKVDVSAMPEASFADRDWSEILGEPAEPILDTSGWKELVELGHKEAGARWSAEDLAEEYALEPGLDRRAIAYISVALEEIGVFQEAGEAHTLESLYQKANTLPDYHRAMRRWLVTLEDEGLIRHEGQSYIANEPLPPPWVNEFLKPQVRELYATNMPAILRGDKHPLEFFIPDGSSEKVEATYTRSPTFRYCNALSAALLERQVELLPPGRKIRILEVGAGTGGTSVSLFPLLPPDRSFFAFTDVSKFFTDRGREKYAEYDFIDYSEMNIENDPIVQGYPDHAYDWIVAAHVLHATRDLRETLRHVRRLMAPGGVLLLLEETKFLRKFNFSMGFLPGFDRFQDEDLRDLHPLLNSEQWGRLLLEEGFTDFATFTDPEALPQKLGVDVMLARLPADSPGPSEATLAKARAAAARAIPRRGESSKAPLSLAQKRLWHFAKAHPGSNHHNVCHAVRLRGELDTDALEKSLREIYRRHEILRTTYHEESGEPVGRVSAVDDVFSLPRTDYGDLPVGEGQEKARRQALETAAKPFDLETGPLFKVELLRLSAEEHVLLVVMHHIAIDGWSLSIFARDLSVIYTAFAKGEASPLRELPVQYGDFAAWQSKRLESEALREQVEEWRKRLAGVDREMPLDFRRERGGERRGDGVETLLPRDVSDRLLKFVKARRVTPFIFFLALFKILLRRASGQDDIVVGTPTAGRPHESLQNLIGYFLNLVPLRTDLSGDPTFSELLDRVRETTLDAFGRQDVPFEYLLESLGYEDDPKRPALVQISFTVPTMGAGEDEAIERDGLIFEPFFTRDLGTELDLAFYAVESPEGIRLSMGYDPILLDRRGVEEMDRRLPGLVEEVLTDPEKRISTLGATG